MIRQVTFERTTDEDPPARFEAGTPSVADAIGLGAAITLGFYNTYAEVNTLVAVLQQWAAK